MLFSGQPLTIISGVNVHKLISKLVGMINFKKMRVMMVWEDLFIYDNAVYNFVFFCWICPITQAIEDRYISFNLNFTGRQDMMKKRNSRVEIPFMSQLVIYKNQKDMILQLILKSQKQLVNSQELYEVQVKFHTRLMLSLMIS